MFRSVALVLGLALALLTSGCGAGTDSALVETNAGAAVPTTPPIVLPPEPSPTAVGVPAVVVPIQPTATAAPQPTPSPTAVPPTAAPEPTAAPTEPPAAPEPTAAPAPASAAPTAAPTQAPEPTLASTPEPSTAELAAAATNDESKPTNHVLTEVGHRPLGQAGSVALVLPVARIEVIGFHEAGHPGSQPINAASSGVEMFTLESRSRGTDARSAADIVVPAGDPVVAPASGVVIAANNYVLYCEHADQLVYIEPDNLPGWQVRVFHVDGGLPAVGTRVEAGITKIADSARLLPFESQVDEFTAEPSWPHVHIEVVDTSVPDTRPPGPGCP